uniref:Peptide deformylase n=1 Tax=Neobodo designis TaxID=312471 RepID=A0A7S1LZX7_NEODS|mmetsp:Transcript_31677/g.97944  ORF Transcript_31677/g.97944 Transcript_31677/m.97944 type:complete len:238 (+) Transcript_31677:146-859(+)|eukprot:CAMPEP_0174853832 /NCGR_PEP_ID=MMETSP1114-20130205/29594_1 /TAXON_ID=312471 /ORGANISM="Neobodo designis, Strain CCAP 1951/1" /LENGTH=237 /DNA_ID=CAMNT_0016088499 /DNA_START=146 /DNA_END=859 /DNA_ORIENTATION=+
MLRRTIARGASTIRQRGDPALERVCVPLSDAVLRNPDEPCITQLPLRVPAPKKVETAPRLVSAQVMFDDLHEALEDFRRANGFGRGIAAPQLGYTARVIAVNLGLGEKHTLINPEWVKRSAETFTMWDDCFSHPDVLVRVRRRKSGAVRFTAPDGSVGEWMRLDQSTCELLQHEMDHLDGKLSFARKAPVEVPPALQAKFQKELELDAAGRVAVLPRAVYEADKEQWEALVSPIINE